MAKDRLFHVTRDVTIYSRQTLEVYAESFEDAESKVDYGYGDFYGEDEYDRDYDSISSVECQDCYATDEDDCECAKAEVDTQFFAGIGL